MATLTDRIAVIIDASTKGATTELSKLQAEAKKSGDSFDTLGAKIGLAGGTIKAGLAGAAGALIGGGLISFLNSSVNAFQESQEAARQWASMTNASLEQAGKFTTLLKGYNVDLNDLVEINAEFSQKIQQQPALLERYNFALEKNRDGTVNMTGTLTNALTALSKMKDGVEKTQAAVALFGEEGSKQLLPLINSGRDLQEVLDRINFVDHSEQAKEFAANSADLALSFQQVQIAVGNLLVPALSDLLQLGVGVIEFFSTLPGWAVDVAEGLGIAAGAVLGFKKAMDFFKSETMGALIVGVLDSLGKIPVAFFEAETAAGKAAVAARTLSTAMGALLRSAGPLVAVFAAVEVGLNAISANERTTASLRGFDDAAASLENLAKNLRETDGIIDSIMSWELPDLFSDTWMNDKDQQRVIDNLRIQTDETLNAADATDTQRQAAQHLQDVMDEGNIKTAEGTAAIEAYFGSLSAGDKVLQDVASSQKSLADAVAEIAVNGNTTEAAYSDLADAVQRTGEAQKKQKILAHESKRVMLDYATAAERAAFYQEDLAMLIEDGVRDGPRFNDAVKAAGDALYRQSQQADLAEQALDDLNYTWGQLVEDLQSTASWEVAGQTIVGGLESLKGSLDSIDFKQVPDRWGDEWQAAAEEARSSILSELARVVEETPTLNPIAWLEDLKKGAPPEIAKVIEGLQAEIEKNPLTLPTEVEDPQQAVKDRIAEINGLLASASPQDRGNLIVIKSYLEAPEGAEQEPVKVPIVVDGIDGPNGAQAKVDGLAQPKETTVTFNAVYNPGYNDMIRRLDVLSEPRSAEVDVTTNFLPDSYNDVIARLDKIVSYDGASPDINVFTHFHDNSYNDVIARLDHILSYDGASPDIDVWVRFNPGSYSDIVARLANITRNRTVDIDVNTRGLAAAERRLSALRANAALTTLQPRVVLPEWEAPTPVNIVKVNVDGKSLRATIRDELLNVRRSDDLVAAMGVVA